MSALTKRQAQVLRFVSEHSAAHGYPPTRVEIGRHFGVFPNAADECLKALAKKGAVILTKGVSRGITVVKEPAK